MFSNLSEKRPYGDGTTYVYGRVVDVEAEFEGLGVLAARSPI
jgi:hypothetical protein